jgi:hypothetical protein
MSVKSYLLSFPERVLRSALGFGAGVAREVGEIALPDGVRNSRLYQNLVDATLRFLIEQVGGVEGVYKANSALPDDFLVRRTAGNAVEALGIVAFRASPVWILAALADLCGMGRHLIPEIADALKAQGPLDEDTQFATVESDARRPGTNLGAAGRHHQHATPRRPGTSEGMGGDSRRCANAAARQSSRQRMRIRPAMAQLKAESARQQRSIFETSVADGTSPRCARPARRRCDCALRVRPGRRCENRSGVFARGASRNHYRQTLVKIHAGRISGRMPDGRFQPDTFAAARPVSARTSGRTLTDNACWTEFRSTRSRSGLRLRR